MTPDYSNQRGNR